MRIGETAGMDQAERVGLNGAVRKGGLQAGQGSASRLILIQTSETATARLEVATAGAGIDRSRCASLTTIRLLRQKRARRTSRSLHVIHG
jgi:hypothetical protein